MSQKNFLRLCRSFTLVRSVPKICVDNVKSINTDFLSQPQIDIKISIRNGPSFHMVVNPYITGEALRQKIYRDIRYRTLSPLNAHNSFLSIKGKTLFSHATLWDQNIRDNYVIIVHPSLNGGCDKNVNMTLGAIRNVRSERLPSKIGRDTVQFLDDGSPVVYLVLHFPEFQIDAVIDLHLRGFEFLDYLKSTYPTLNLGKYWITINNKPLYLFSTFYDQGVTDSSVMMFHPRMRGGVSPRDWTRNDILVHNGDFITVFVRAHGNVFPLAVHLEMTGEQLDLMINEEVLGGVLSREEYWYCVNGRPLRMNLSLREQNIHPSVTLELLPRLAGGFKFEYDKLVFTNYLIKECEEQLDCEYPLQSDDMPFVTRKFVTDYIKQAAKEIEPDAFLILFEDVLVCVKYLMRSNNVMDIYGAVALFYRLRTGKSLSLTLIRYIEQFMDEIFSPQSEEPSAFQKLRECFTNIEMFKKSDLVAKIMRVLTLVMSLSYCTSTGKEFIFKHFISLDRVMKFSSIFSGVDVITSILELVLFICEKGYQCITTGSFSSLFHSGEKYSQWCEDVQKLKMQSNHLNDPEALGFTESEFLGNLDKAIEQGQDMRKFMEKTKRYEVRYVTQLLNELIYIQAEQLTTQKARENRDAPFSILINGTSNIGKSTIVNMLFNHYGKIFDLPLEDKYKYTKNPVAKYWDGFRSYMWCLLIDDIAFMHPNTATNGDPSVMEVIQIQNNVSFTPDQANLTDKGRTPFRGRLTIATTNTKHLNAIHYFNCPLAVQRRLPFVVTVAPKPEYTTDGFLDSNKTPQTDTYPDLWLWKVEKVKPGVGERCSYEEIFSTGNVHEFLSFFGKEAVSFRDKQKLIKESNNVISNLTICKQCYKDMSNCDCVNLQSLMYMLSIWRYMFQFLILKLIYVCPKLVFVVYPMCYKMNCTFPELEHIFYHRLGDAIGESNFGKKVFKYVSSCVVCASAGLLAYKMYRTATETCNFDVQDLTGKKPIPKEKERDNVWFQEDFEVTKFDITRASESAKELTLGELSDIVTRNILTLVCSSKADGKIIYSNTCATCLLGNIYIANWHSFKNMNDIFTIRLSTGVKNIGISNDLEITINKKQFRKVPESDLVLFTIPNIPPKRNLFKFIPVNHLTGSHVGMIFTNAHRKPLIHTVRYAKFLKLNVVGVGEIMPCYKGVVSGDIHTEYGQCGSPFFIKNGAGYHFAGIHVAGKDENIIEISICQTLLKPFIDEFPEMQISAGPIEVSAPSCEKTILPLHHKASIRFIEEGVCDVYGSISGFRTTHKSQVENTMMNDWFAKKGYETKYTKPDLETWRPKHLALKEMVTPQTLWDATILDDCVQAFTQDIISKLTDEDFSMLHPIDLDTNLNGAPGVAYIDGIKRSTSAGYPWRKSKKEFLTYIEDGTKVSVDNEILELMENMEATYLKGERANFIFSANLKDEPVTFKKRKLGKTRVFACASFPTVLLMRKYLLTFVRVVQNNKFLFEAGPGTIAQSIEWEQIYNYLTKFGLHKIVAGDFGKFDKKMAAMLIRAAFKLIRNIMIRAGCNSDHIKIVDGIGADIGYPMMDYFGELIGFFGSNPSGHPLTVIINSLVNSLYMRYVFVVLTGKNSSEFKNFVNLFTYGDDNIMGVSDDVPEFNHTNISKILALHGVEYTMADKEAESIPYIHIRDATFLKRSWRFDADIGHMLCPLDHDSIEKMIMTNIRSKFVPHEFQCVSILQSAIREYFFYGKSVFNEKRALFVRAVNELNLLEWMEGRDFPTWNQLKSEFDSFSIE